MIYGSSIPPDMVAIHCPSKADSTVSVERLFSSSGSKSLGAASDSARPAASDRSLLNAFRVIRTARDSI